jgi:hypothetical protein
MIWKKAPGAAAAWCGGVSPKVLYAAHTAGRLKAAHVGITSRRNLLFCEEWCQEWLLTSAESTRDAQRQEPPPAPISMRRRA